MRTVLTFVALVSAVLVPWGSLAPAWLPDASGSAISHRTKAKAPAARISPDLGILPLPISDEYGTESTNDAPFQAPDAPAAPHAPRVVCENGVCRLVNDADSDPVVPAANLQLERARHQLQELGATQVRLDSDPTGVWRCSCSVPVSRGSKVMRRFETTASSDEQAVTDACSCVQAWLQDRR